MNESATDSTPLLELQREAIRVAFSPSRFVRGRFALRALGRLLADTGDTGQVLAMAIVLNAPHFMRIWLVMSETEEGRQVLAERPALDSRGVDREWLRALPEGTLGREYVRFLDDNGLDGDFFQAPPDVPAEVAYLSQRLRQSHDVWHPVTGYGPSVRDELALQAFTWAQLGLPHAKLVVVGGLLRFGLGDRGLLGHVLEGYRRGKRARAFAPVHWESRWERPLAEVRAELGVALG